MSSGLASRVISVSAEKWKFSARLFNRTASSAALNRLGVPPPRYRVSYRGAKSRYIAISRARTASQSGTSAGRSPRRSRSRGISSGRRGHGHKDRRVTSILYTLMGLGEGVWGREAGGRAPWPSPHEPLPLIPSPSSAPPRRRFGGSPPRPPSSCVSCRPAVSPGVCVSG